MGGRILKKFTQKALFIETSLLTECLNCSPVQMCELNSLSIGLSRIANCERP
jgi:hypothetical protein